MALTKVSTRSVPEMERENPIKTPESQSPRNEIPVSISSSLQSSGPVTSKSGLGYVHAGILLWHEAEEADDES